MPSLRTAVIENSANEGQKLVLCHFAFGKIAGSAARNDIAAVIAAATIQSINAASFGAPTIMTVGLNETLKFASIKSPLMVLTLRILLICTLCV
jgi:hypothetical protein